MFGRVLFLAIASTLSGAAAQTFELKSPDLADGARIGKAQIYPRCGGDNVAPALAWSGAPAGTKSFILTFVDTSVLPSGWSHWIVVDIPASVASLPRGGAIPAGAKAIQSNFGDTDYAGPCPPAGTGTHRYEFTLFAMPTSAPVIVDDSSANDLTEALGALALAKASLRGTANSPH